jgi:hypothetical protein
MQRGWGFPIFKKVEELIDPNRGNRDEALIRDIFWHVDVYRILQILLPNYGQSDFIACHINKNGWFTIKSAYHIEWIVEYQMSAMPSDSSDRSVSHEIWKKIWKAKVSLKVQIFN